MYRKSLLLLIFDLAFLEHKILAHHSLPHIFYIVNYGSKSIPEMLEVSDSNVLVVYRTKKLKPWSNF